MVKRDSQNPNGDLLKEARRKVENRSPKRTSENDNSSRPSSPLELIISKARPEPIKSKIETLRAESESSLSHSRRTEQDDELESARAEMDEAREENERLKTYLDRIMRDYKTLQTQFLDIVKQDNLKQQPEEQLEESSLVSLSLGRGSGSYSPGKDEKCNKLLSGLPSSTEQRTDDDRGLALSLDCKFDTVVDKSVGTTESNLASNTSPENSSEDQKEEGVGEIWPPSKVLKTMRSNNGEDEVSQQNPAKKARVCVRARCDTPTMNDGCQWRKYGQKIAKGNPCPRAYYRCTVALFCPVRKQVQRCAQDMSILITTYEGTHNHPLPISATAMASTTSAAASMLLSGSSTSSGSGQIPPAAATTNLHGLNFYLSDPSRSKVQFYMPNSSPVAPPPSHPTITLDLTSSESSMMSSSSAPSYLNQFSSGANYYNSMARSSTSLSFGSTEPVSSRPASWGYTGHHQLFNKANFNPQETTLLQKTNYNNTPHDSLAPAATNAITADPNFQSALAAALKTIIGDAGSGGNGPTTTLGNGHGGFTASSGSIFGQSVVNSCGPSYLNKSSTAPSTTSPNHWATSLMFLQSNPISLPVFSSSMKNNKAAATSPGDNRDRTSL